ncbi:MAG: DNA mismatch repair endonuclease MutL [Planctomycetes bacterium]|nr:DNA mismatch repair endonuclease MutL [Planctomycetota bacterium]
MAIRVLPREVVDRIAAGEVIERPASVVKELVENALDAGADRIELELEEGGRALIRVVDNGGGIPAEELRLAFTSHATSKIRDAEELFHVASLGFRGEALASIAAVSRARLRSRVPGGEAAAEVQAQAGECGEPAPAAGPEGTLVEVRDLFFNTPVRRRFLKTVRSEVGQVAEWLTRLALSRPDVAFRLQNDGREVLRLPADGGLAARIRRLFGPEIANRMLPVDGASGPMQLAGFVLPPGVDRPDARWVYLFVNGRFVRDRTWLAGVREAYRGLLLRGRTPVAFLELAVDPAEVDVNVHPTKEEVRFREPSRLFALTLRGVSAALGRVDLRPEIHDARTAAAEPGAPGPRHRARRGSDRPLRPDGGSTPSSGRCAEETTEERCVREGPELPFGGSSAAGPARQFLRTYLMRELPGGLEVTDQHALHERILFERIRSRLAHAPLPVQLLLVPEVIAVGPRGQALLEGARGRLESLGLRFEPYGPDRIAVGGVPELLRKVDPGRLVADLLGFLEREEGCGALEAISDELVATLACRGAIKAGDVLTDGDIAALLEQGEAVARSPFCPHGRPVTVHVAVGEIERWFRRGV